MKKLALLLLLAPLAALATYQLPIFSSTVGTAIACNSGVSPCNISTTAVDVLSANANRVACNIFPFGTAAQVVMYCKRATAATNAASSTNFDFALNPPLSGQSGAGWRCHDSGAIWTGPVNCAASGVDASKNLGVSETQ